jgi:DNA repair protein RecO (recombination protein O)
MALVQTEAIVLRTYNLAEADRIVLCLTRSAGLIRAVAHGARRMKSRFGAALEPFTLIKLIFHERENRELVTISQTEILKSRFDLVANPGVVEALAYIGELVVEFAPPHQGDEKLFRMVSACVDALEASPPETELVLRYFEVWLLRLAGFFPDFGSCAECGAPLDETGAYLNADAKARCYKCSLGAGTLLWRETRECMAATQRLSPLKFASSSSDLAPKFRKQLADIMQQQVVRVLERRPRTLAALPQESLRTPV